MLEETLYDDEHGKDLLIAGLHNVCLGRDRETLSSITHKSRDGKPMQVQFNQAIHSYYVIVAS